MSLLTVEVFLYDLTGVWIREVLSLAADISKSLDAKRKRLETFTDSSIKASNKKVDEVWSTQREERYGIMHKLVWGGVYLQLLCSEIVSELPYSHG